MSAYLWTGAFEEVRAAGIGVVGTVAFRNYRSSSSNTFRYYLYSLFLSFLCSGFISGVVGAWNWNYFFFYPSLAPVNEFFIPGYFAIFWNLSL